MVTAFNLLTTYRSIFSTSLLNGQVLTLTQIFFLKKHLFRFTSPWKILTRSMSEILPAGRASRNPPLMPLTDLRIFLVCKTCSVFRKNCLDILNSEFNTAVDTRLFSFPAIYNIALTAQSVSLFISFILICY